MKKLLILISLAVISALFVACGGDDDNGGASAATAGSATPANTGPTATPTDFPDSGPVTLHLGYLANITHAPALVGLNNGIFQQELGSEVTIDSKSFNAGPDIITALFAGDIDAAYIGPSPAINGYVQSDGNDVRIISGAVSGGAFLVVQPDIKSAADLANKKIATPQLGNTQDVALRTWLLANNLGAVESGGNVTVVPTANADALNAFKNKQIDGAWEPEPWATRMVQEGGGHVLVNEKDLWPNGQFSTTVLIARTGFLKDHPDVIERLVRANIKTTQYIQQNPDQAKTIANQALNTITGKPLSDAVINAAWPNITPTFDPLKSAVETAADNAYKLGFLQDKPDLKSLFDLDILNRVLAQEGLPAVVG